MSTWITGQLNELDLHGSISARDLTLWLLEGGPPLIFDPQTYQCRQKGTSLIPFPAQLSETVIFDVPYFDLVQAPNVKGMVSWGSHDPGTKLRANPLSLLKELEGKFGQYPAKKWIYGFTWPSAGKTQEMEGPCKKR